MRFWKKFVVLAGCSLLIDLFALPHSVVLAGEDEVPPQIVEAAAQPERPKVPCADLADFAKGLGSLENMRANFREEKHIQLMQEPLITEGTMLYISPDRLGQRMTQPARQTVIIDKGRLRIVQHDLEHEETMQLDANPFVRAVIQNILLLMSGRVDKVWESYHCTAQNLGDRVVLHLEPRQKPLKKVFRSMKVVVGTDLKMRQITMEEVGGDTSILTFDEVEHNVSLDDKEVRAHFNP